MQTPIRTQRCHLEKCLSLLDIRTDDEMLKTKFYSNLYHSLLKPCDMSDENILGAEGEIVTDFATLWDKYKNCASAHIHVLSETGTACCDDYTEY